MESDFVRRSQSPGPRGSAEGQQKLEELGWYLDASSSKGIITHDEKGRNPVG